MQFLSKFSLRMTISMQNGSKWILKSLKWPFSYPNTRSCTENCSFRSEIEVLGIEITEKLLDNADNEVSDKMFS